MNEVIQQRLEKKEEQRKNLDSALIEAESKEERTAIKATIDELDAEIAELRNLGEALDAPVEVTETKIEERGFIPMETMNANEKNVELEARKAFQKFIATGDVAEYRAAAGNSTGADNVGTAIPENLVNQIIEKIEQNGAIYALVTKTSFPVGQTIPTEATKPVATWVGRNTSTLSSSTSGEGNGSSVGKTVLGTAITFSHFKLRCEVAMTEEVAVMALPAFEALFVKNVATAMLRAIESAIIDGDGYGQPTGILNNIPTAQKVNVAKTAKLSYQTLCDAEALVPAHKEQGAKWVMTKKSFMAFIGMVDSNGQPIARVNYGINGKVERTLLGREVVLYVPQSGSKLGDYADTVSTETNFAAIYDFSDYILNSNYNLGIQSKVDWDNEDHRTKAVAAYDGKPVDLSSLVVLVKKSA